MNLLPPLGRGWAQFGRPLDLEGPIRLDFFQVFVSVTRTRMVMYLLTTVPLKKSKCTKILFWRVSPKRSWRITMTEGAKRTFSYQNRTEQKSPNEAEGYGRPIETTRDHRKPRDITEDHGRPRESTGDHGRLLETLGDHRSQFPHTDVGGTTESKSLPTPPGPLKLRLSGDESNMVCSAAGAKHTSKCTHTCVFIVNI